MLIGKIAEAASLRTKLTRSISRGLREEALNSVHCEIESNHKIQELARNWVYHQVVMR